MRQLRVIFCVLAVAVLCSCNQTEAQVTTLSDSDKNSAPEAGSIVYVQIDSLVNNYDMFNDLRTEFEAKWQGVQNDLQNKSKKFQNDVNKFQNDVNKGLITRAEAEERNQVLTNRQNELQDLSYQKQYEMQEEEAVLMNKVIDAVRTYLEKYNKTKKYSLILSTSESTMTVLTGDTTLDITEDVLVGLNNEYVKSKKSNKSDKEEEETES